jgi:hypothetical protein
MTKIVPGFFLLELLLAWPQIVFGQSPPPVSKDPTAVAVLINMVGATGWNSTNLPTDAEANGSMTVVKPTGQEVDSAVFKARPGIQMRIENQSRSDTLIVNGFRGVHLTSQGNQEVAPHSAPSMLPTIFPFFTLLGDYNSPDVSVAYLGTENIQGAVAHRIELKRIIDFGGQPHPFLARASRIVIAISATNFLPLKIEFDMISARNPNSGAPVACYLDDYRRVGSILAPFHLVEFVMGKEVFAIQLDNEQLNVGLPDSDFNAQ